MDREYISNTIDNDIYANQRRLDWEEKKLRSKNFWPIFSRTKQKTEIKAMIKIDFHKPKPIAVDLNQALKGWGFSGTFLCALTLVSILSMLAMRPSKIL